MLKRTGALPYRFFEVFIGASLSLTNLTLDGGDAGDLEEGGAILNRGGAVTLNNTSVSHNHAKTGGGIENHGTLILNSSTLTANAATQGGGLHNTIGGLSSMTTINNSTITSNAAEVAGGGIYSQSGTLVISNSHIDGNSAPEGGGIYNSITGTLSITTHSVVAGNDATALRQDQVSARGGGGINNRGTLTIADSAIIGNMTGDSGGGIYNSFGTLEIDGSLIANNIAVSGAALYSTGTVKAGAKDPREDHLKIGNSCIMGNQGISLDTGEKTPDGITHTKDAPTLQAATNWWGDATGPTGSGKGKGDSVSSNVSFTPFLNRAPDICASTLPSPVATASADTVGAVSEYGCTGDPNVKVSLPAIPAYKYVCAIAPDGSSAKIAIVNKADDQLASDFKGQIKVCFQGNAIISVASIDGTSDPTPLDATTDNGQTCVKVLSSVILTVTR